MDTNEAILSALNMATYEINIYLSPHDSHPCAQRFLLFIFI